MLDDIAEVKRLKEVRPDAVVKIELDGKIFFLPLEYEASSKFSKRNEKLLAKYYTCPHVPAVLFISKTDSIEKRIKQKEAARKSKGTGRFYYCLLKNVIGAKEKLSFVNVKNETLQIS